MHREAEPTSPSPPLVLAVGNPLCGDDGAGAAAADLLAAHPAAAATQILRLPAEPSRLIDSWAGRSLVIVIDAAAPAGAPGRVRRLDATHDALPVASGREFSSHGFGLATSIELARAIGCLPERLIVYAIEGESFDAGAGLSPPVGNALPVLVTMLVEELEGGPKAACISCVVRRES